MDEVGTNLSVLCDGYPFPHVRPCWNREGCGLFIPFMNFLDAGFHAGDCLTSGVHHRELERKMNGL